MIKTFLKSLFTFALFLALVPTTTYAHVTEAVHPMHGTDLMVVLLGVALGAAIVGGRVLWTYFTSDKET